MTQDSGAADAAAESGGLSLLDIAVALAENKRFLLLGPVLAGLLALGISFLIAPTFTARTSFLPPQQQQSAAASALASLGAMAGLAGSLTSVKNPTDQYVSLMQSTTVQDRLIDRFDLLQVYEADYRFQARRALQKNVRIDPGRRDGLIVVEVSDVDPQRAADLANAHVEELRRVTNQLAITEAQQRRQFFEEQLQQSKERLAAAQVALQATGFTQGALRAEPRAAADEYARLRAEVTAAQVRLQTMRSALSDNAPELQQQQATLAALRAQLARAEQRTEGDTGQDYISKYREFKYQETLFDLFARQYEMARLDESREGALIQVVDAAQRPEWKSAPKRAVIAATTALAAFMGLLVFVAARHSLRRSSAFPEVSDKIARLRSALGRR